MKVDPLIIGGAIFFDHMIPRCFLGHALIGFGLQLTGQNDKPSLDLLKRFTVGSYSSALQHKRDTS